MVTASKSLNLRQRRPSNLRLWLLFRTLCLSIFFLGSTSTESVAHTIYWNGGDGNWDNANNWSSTSPPGGGDKAYIVQSDSTDRTITYNTSHAVPEAERLEYVRIDGTGSGLPTLNLTGGDFYSGGGFEGPAERGDVIIGFNGTGHFTQTGGTHNLDVFGLYLGYNAGSSGTYDLDGGDLIAYCPTAGISTIVYVGLGGVGIFNQTGGTNDAERVYLGADLTGSGTYNLDGGELIVHDELVGPVGQGVFNQTGGTNTVGFFLTLGGGPDGNGTFNLSGGSLSAVGEDIGRYGTGLLSQSGGTNDSGAYLYIGRFSGSDGTYELDDGTLDAYEEFIGYDGTGLFRQTGGENTVTKYGLNLGHNSGSSGTYELSGGILSAAGETIGDKGTGHFTQDGGTNSIATLRLALNGGDGTYVLNDGTLDVTKSLYIGQNGTGLFIQTGGVNNVGANGLIVNGTYNLSGGSLNIATSETIGGSSTSVFTQTGGTNSVTSSLLLSNVSGGSDTYNLSGGSLSAGQEVIGRRGAGVFDQTGGVNTISGYSWSRLVLGSDSGSSGTYHLSGGELNVAGDIVNFTGASTLNIDGGTLILQNNTSGSIDVDNFNVGSASGLNGSFTLYNGQSLLASSENIGKDGTGAFTQTGGTHTVSQTLTIATNSGSAGTYNLEDGTLTAGNIVNNDTFVFSGGNLNLATDGSGTFANNADANFDIKNNTLIVNGNVTNHGTVKTTNATVTFTGTYTEFGAYISDPSENYFPDLIVEASGYLLGGAGDKFFVDGDFTNNSAQSGLWDTADAYLGFPGFDIVHAFSLAEVADVNKPYDYAWGTLELLDGGGLTLLGGDDVSLFVANLILSLDSTLDVGAIDIYVVNLECEGATVLGTGEIKIVPLPSAIVLLGAGLIGLVGFRKKVGK